MMGVCTRGGRNSGRPNRPQQRREQNGEAYRSKHELQCKEERDKARRGCLMMGWCTADANKNNSSGPGL